MTDKELYEGIATKSNTAFLHLYNHHFSAIVKMVKSNSGNEDDALDIFQEGMVALWINIKKDKYIYSEQAKVSTYLYSVCRNLWYKKLRSKTNTVDFENYERTEPSEEDEILDESHDRIEKLKDNFSQLGEKCKEILNLFYYKKASMKDIAEKFNYEVKTAKNEKYRCMKRLRSMY